MPGGHVVVALSGEIAVVTAPAARDVLAGASRAARHLPGGLRLVAVPARVLRLPKPGGAMTRGGGRVGICCRPPHRMRCPSGAHHQRLPCLRS